MGLAERMTSLSGKNALVTGASSGIGRGVAEAMAEAGAHVALVGRDTSRLADVKRQIVDTGGQAVTVAEDLTEPGAPDRVLGETLEALGSLEILVHSAGLFEPRPFEEIEVESLDRQWAINVRAPFLLTQAAVPHLSSGSSITFLSSIAGLIGFPGGSAYCATKGGVELLTKALGVELASRGIRVNAIAPGNIRTPMNEHLMADPEYMEAMLGSTPAGAVGEVDQIAALAVLLASEAGGFMFGSSVVADGGWTAA